MNQNQMKKSVLSLLLIMAGVMTVFADNMTVGGLNRTYNKIVPKNLGENRPLLIFCHGYNQDANWMQNSEFKNETVSMEAVCDTAKFICVFPDGIAGGDGKRSWDINGDRDINFIKAIIEKMVTQYKIDRNRVYMGGFSMGGMLTYSAINKMHDQIAAFISCSGPLQVTANSTTPPVPLLHIQGTADNWGGVQPALNIWINHNGCPTNDKVISNYNGFSGAKLHIWGPGRDGVEVRLIELKDKGHWICKESQVYTGKEIWNFCKKYSLKKTAPTVQITSPKSAASYYTFAPSGTEAFPDITITATADDPNGTIEKVEFYDGTKLLGTCTAKPYKLTLTGLKKGSRTITVKATDNDGETGNATFAISYLSLQSLNMSSAFNEGGAVPTGWTTFDGDEKRTGKATGFSQGCRVLQFTGTPRGLDYGLYIRNKNGKVKEGYAKFAISGSGRTLAMAPGHYTLKYKICNWNMENFGQVSIAIEKPNGTAVATHDYMPTVNIGDKADKSFGNINEETFEFDITEQGEYVIAFYTADAGWADCILGSLSLKNDSYDTTPVIAVHDIQQAGRCYDIQGREVKNLENFHGIYIKNGKKYVIK